MTEFREKMAQLDQRVLDDIARVGWSDMAIFPTKDKPGLSFNYTIGFKERDHAEILMMGLDMRTMHGVLGVVYDLVKSGTRFIPDTYYNFVLNGHRVAFVEITDPVGNDYPMTMTEHIEGEFKALQLVWPDEKDLFPWHEDYDKKLQAHQELLGPWRGDRS